ncbi:class I SAM-dependent methyltransferase [Nocardiopsis sp. CA-288880]|uniref:class I SAM-dependent methyltransferase n=1 Tax=Nocardiopsis sp. CA-288880 TaxID=3239995 RepID=UPI003D98D690
MTEARADAPAHGSAPREPGDTRLTLAQVLEHPALGPRDLLPDRFRGPRRVTGDGWVGFATRLERGEELSLVQSLMAANRHVLDVGGGIGELSRAVAARIGHCTTVEPHAQLVESMRDEAAEAGVSVFAGTAEDLPFPDASFDAVYGAWVLPFVDDVGKAVTEMVRVCDPDAPEAKIVLIVGGADSEVLGLFNDVCAPVSGDPRDHHGYLLATAARLLAERGFGEFSLHRTEASVRFAEEEPAKRAAEAATVLTDFWYQLHPGADEVRAALEPALERHFAARPHGIGDQGAVLVARPGS